MITNKRAQSWRTPSVPFACLMREYKFTIDLAASLSNHLLPRYYTAAHDSLSRSWRGERGYWNPPFSSVAQWLAYAIKQRDENGVFSVGLVLGSIETAWFHDLAVNVEKHIFRRRVAYEPPRGVVKSTPSFPSILLIMNPDRPTYGNGLRFTRVRDGVSGEYIDEGNLNVATLSHALQQQGGVPLIDGGRSTWNTPVVPPPYEHRVVFPPVSRTQHELAFIDDDLPF
jgi:phage N-6-adenine-methyltransferase